jgi:glycerophosphoryl diester phosphodiesterase
MDIKPKTLSNNLLTIAFLFFLSGIISLTNVQPILAEYTSLKKSLCSNRNLETLSSSFLPRYIAHQGCVSKHYHGNTLEAIYESLHHPVAGIEIDIRLSKDHVPFLFHDDTLGESTNGSGKPEKYTWSQLQKLSYTTPEKERIPSLEEVLRLIEYRKFSFLDIKTSHFRNAPFVKQLAKLIYKYHLQNTVVIESLNPFFLKSMRMKAPDIRLMYDFMIDSKAIGEEI